MNIPTHIEHWRMIDGYLNYEISSHGRVRNINTSKILKQSFRNNYYCIGLYSDGKQIKYDIHRLVAIAFCDNNDNLNVVDHIDRNKHNNLYSNLRWVSSSTNNKNAKLRIRNNFGYNGVHYSNKKEKWIASYNDLNKVRHRKSFNTKEEALTYRKEMEQLNGYTIGIIVD